MIRIRQIKLPTDHSENDLKNKILKKLNVRKIEKYKINKKSIDARKNSVCFVYEVDVKVKNENKFLNRTDVLKTPDESYNFEITGCKKLKNNPVIIGSGPAGLFCGYMLAQNGYKPIIIERGEDIDSRIKTVEKFWKNGVLNPNSNVQFGEGGAGTFSDGKLTTQVKDVRRGKKILETFVKNGAPKEILYLNKPHIGTDLLRSVIKNIRNDFIKMGGTILYNSLMTDMEIKDNKLLNVTVNGKKIKTDSLVLAIGHSARDTFNMLIDKKLNISSKPFAVGVRVQHKQSLIDKNQYGNLSKNLPKASYKLTYKAKNNRGVYSFCMCPGGFVVNSSSEKNLLAINGMSNHNRDEENANSAIVVTVTPNDFGTTPKEAINYQKELEKITYQKGNGNIPIQLLKDFYKNKTTTKLGKIKPIFKGNYTLSNLNEILPSYVTEALKESFKYFDKKINGFADDDVILAAIESRTSSPIRIERNESLMSNVKGIYPCGEGAGFAGGIMSAAIDGIKVAEEIMKIYKPF